MAIVCPNCSADLPDDAVFCDQCGASLGAGAPSPAASALVAPTPSPAGEDVCPQCGAPTIPGEAFCDSCGASLAEPQIAAPPVIAAEPEVEPPAAPAPAVPDLAQCPACGADNLPGSKFCSNCGILMEEKDPVAEPEPVDAELVPEVEPGLETLVEAEPVMEEDAEVIPVPEPPAPTGRYRFVVRDTGAEITLPMTEGEHIIGREDPVSSVFPEVDMNPYEGEHFGVSRRHAQLTVDAGLVFIQDLDSTNFTFVNRQKLVPHTPTALSNGDEVRLGKLVMTFLE